MSAKRLLIIIAAIATHNAPTLSVLEKATNIPAPTLKRLIGQLRSEYGMDIRFVPAGNSKGRVGHYHIYSWGVFDRNEILLRHAQDLIPLEEG